MTEENITKLLRSNNIEDQLVGLHICKANHPKDRNWVDMMCRLIGFKALQDTNIVLRLYSLGCNELDSNKLGYEQRNINKII